MTQVFLVQLDPGKTLGWGKPVARELFFIFQFLEITYNNENKNQQCTYLFPRFLNHKITEEIAQQAFQIQPT